MTTHDADKLAGQLEELDRSSEETDEEIERAKEETAEVIQRAERAQRRLAAA